MDTERRVKIGITENENFLAIDDLVLTQSFEGVNPIVLNYAGREQCSPGYTFGPFVRSHYVIHIVVSGCGELMKEGRTWKIGPGSAFLIRPGENTTYRADLKDPWLYKWIGFHGFRAEEIMVHAGLTKDNPVAVLRDTDRILEEMDRLLQLRDLAYSTSLLRTGCLYRIMALFVRSFEEQLKETGGDEGKTDFGYVKKTVDILNESYTQHVRVGEIAKKIGISRNYLSDLFKKEMGVSPQEYLINLRMDIAASLLRSTGKPVSEIALEVGYSDPLSFSKTFRRKWNVSPTTFRQMSPEVVSNTKKGTYVSDDPL